MTSQNNENNMSMTRDERNAFGLFVRADGQLRRSVKEEERKKKTETDENQSVRVEMTLLNPRMKVASKTVEMTSTLGR